MKIKLLVAGTGVFILGLVKIMSNVKIDDFFRGYSGLVRWFIY